MALAIPEQSLFRAWLSHIADITSGRLFVVTTSPDAPEIWLVPMRHSELN
jgi:hypothetical protein